MKIAVGCDHGGFCQKADLVEYIESLGHEVVDFGTNSEDSVDYPDYGDKVARAVASGEADRGVLICGTGIGISMTADKVPGIRSSAIHDTNYAHLFREHNNGNVIGLSGRFVSVDENKAILDEFLNTEFAGGRHAARVAKLMREDDPYFSGTDRFTIVSHPLVQHKLHILRDKDTSTKQFRELVTELAVFEGYEAMRDLPLEDVDVETPLETAHCKRIAGKKLAIIPILRAGLGMVDGILQLAPSARVGHVGMERDHETHEPRSYYCKLPSDIANRVCLVVDPMLATGGSLTATIQFLRDAGAKDIRCLTLVSAPEGVKAVLDFDPDVRLYTCALDRELNENAYILPGLGDAGDRIYGTL